MRIISGPFCLQESFLFPRSLGKGKERKGIHLIVSRANRPNKGELEEKKVGMKNKKHAHHAMDSKN